MRDHGNFDLRLPARVVCRAGGRREIGALARQFGRRALLVHGSRALERLGAVDELAWDLTSAGIEVIQRIESRGEPTIDAVDRVVSELRELDRLLNLCVVVIGGGAAIDFAKGIAAMAVTREPLSVRDYLEGIGRGLSLQETPLPIVALPTTGGTGAEATRNAVIACDDPPTKKSLRHDGLLPRAVLIDPELAVHAPPEVTAHSGMDAITQLIESCLTPRGNAITRQWCVEGLKLALPALPEAYAHPDSLPARQDMALAALLSGMALANSGLGMAHGVAAALGGMFGTPHGLACAVMLPIALRTNRPACELELRQLAEMLGLRDAAELLDTISELGQRLGIPRKLSAIGVTRGQLPALAAASRGNSMSGNPRNLSDEELVAILEENL